MTRFSRGCALLAAASFVAACGSTVAGTGTGTGANGAAGALNGSADGALGASELGASELGQVGVPGAPGTSTLDGSSPLWAVGLAGGGAAAGAPGGSLAQPGTAGAAGAGPAAPGGPAAGAGGQSAGQPLPANAPEVEVGIMIASDAESFGSGLGLDFSHLGDQRGQAKAVIAEINKSGGLGGRRVVPVFADFRLTRADSYSSQLEAICERWTKDHKVIAGLSIVNLPSEAVAACMQKSNALYITPDQHAKLPDVYSRLPLLFDSANLSAWRMASSYVKGLNDLQYFKGKPKIGLLRFDSAPTKAATDKVLKPELAKLGLKVDDEVTVAVPNSTSGISETVTQAQSAVLRFKANGVTHVMTILPGAWVLFFMQQASNQDYFPQYGLSSYDWPHTLVRQGAPREQLVNSVTVGWDVNRDVDPNRLPYATQPGSERCRNIMLKASQGSRISLYCDGLFLLQAGAAVAGAANGSQVAGGIERLGTTFQSPVLLGKTQLGPGRHDPAATYQQLTYDRACNCFSYVGQQSTLG